MDKQIESKQALTVEKKVLPEQLVFSLGGSDKPTVVVDVIRSTESSEYRFEIRDSGSDGDAITVTSAFSKSVPLEKVVNNAIQSLERLYSRERVVRERDWKNTVNVVANHFYYWSNINDFRSNALNLVTEWNNALSDVHPGNVIDITSRLIVPCVSIKALNELAQIKLTSPCRRYRTIITVAPTVCSDALDKCTGDWFGTISGRTRGEYMLVISNDTFKDGKAEPNTCIFRFRNGDVTGKHLLQSMFQKKAIDLVVKIAETWFEAWFNGLDSPIQFAPYSNKKLNSLISELEEHCS